VPRRKSPESNFSHAFLVAAFRIVETRNSCPHQPVNVPLPIFITHGQYAGGPNARRFASPARRRSTRMLLCISIVFRTSCSCSPATQTIPGRKRKRNGITLLRSDENHVLSIQSYLLHTAAFLIFRQYLSIVLPEDRERFSTIPMVSHDTITPGAFSSPVISH
jgi:hypothetical protein